jgi:hypothetical protein
MMMKQMIEELHQMLFWPGDTVIASFVTTHPQLALWLGLGADSAGGFVSALISVFVGWGLYMLMAHLMLFGVQLWEARRDR